MNLNDSEPASEKPFVIGFTGTRHLPDGALNELVLRLDSLQASGYVTGACVGVDHHVGLFLCSTQDVRHTVIVPADRSRITAWWRTLPSGLVEVEEMPPDTTFANRNAEIVHRSDKLIAIPAAPEDAPESRRSGTWQTVRMARRKGIPIEIWLVSDLLGEMSEDRRVLH